MLKNFTVNEQVGPVADRQGLVYIVISDQNADIFILQPRYYRLDILNGYRINTCKRLVEQDKLGVYRQRPRNFSPSSLPAAERVSVVFAHMVQRPRERLGVALVMRGAMGSGKTKVGEVFGSLCPRHYFLVDDPRYVVGQFNAHMASCLLLQADEAVWAGDKAAEGRLKGLITSTIQQIEAKGIDPIRLTNYVRLIMTSNEDWVVPAGKDERRFCVLDVDPRCAQQHDYFREMDEELNNGGREALLADLLAFDLDSVNLRKIPRTGALLEQKIRSFDSVEMWWFEVLMRGAVTRDGEAWPSSVQKSQLVDDYIASAERIGIKRKAAETELGMKLAKLVPGLRSDRVTIYDDVGIARRRHCFILPPLEECREAYAEALQQPVDWPEP